MINKKAQSQIITTVLIILLVLAAIVIVWQVVNNTIKGGAGQLESQGNCLGVSLEVTNTNPGTDTIFSIKRKGGGDINPEPHMKIIKDGTETTCTWNPVDPDWTKDFASATCTLASAATGSVEVALLLEDGTACPITGVVLNI
ncbi:MAG: hypothetical protein ABIH37_05755 [archaeon]